MNQIRVVSEARDLYQEWRRAYVWETIPIFKL